MKALGDYKPLWDPELYFTVNIAFGQFAFSTAKVIDVVWDAVVARGGQMLAATVAYRTLRRSLTLNMETSTVTMPTIATLYCHQIQVTSLRRLSQDILWHEGSSNPQLRRPMYLGEGAFVHASLLLPLCTVLRHPALCHHGLSCPIVGILILWLRRGETWSAAARQRDLATKYCHIQW